jgi:hypothetical protein
MASDIRQVMKKGEQMLPEGSFWTGREDIAKACGVINTHASHSQPKQRT